MKSPTEVQFVLIEVEPDTELTEREVRAILVSEMKV